MIVLRATNRLSCIEAYDVSDDHLSKFYFSGGSPFLRAFAWPCLFCLYCEPASTNELCQVLIDSGARFLT